MKQIIVVKPSSISEEQKQFLKENNCRVIEHLHPAEVRIVSLIEGFDGDDMFNSLVAAMQEAGIGTKQRFAEVFLSKIQSRKIKE